MTSPPIWTIRIIKHLVKEQWSPPPEEQADLFEALKKHAAACNEHDLPGPDVRTAKTMQLGNIGKRVYAAKVTIDGELIFLLDDKYTAIDIRRLSDLSEVSRIRLDMINGKVYAPLAFAITEYGEHLAVLVRESSTGDTKIHLYELDFGEVISEKWVKFEPNFACDQVPKLAITNDSKTIFIQMGEDIISVIPLDSKENQLSFVNVGHEESFRYIRIPYAVSKEHSFHDWQNYGRHGLKEPSAQSLSVKAGVLAIPGNTEFTIKKEPYEDEEDRYVWSTTGVFAFSECGRYFATIHDNSVFIHNLNVEAGAISPTPTAYPSRHVSVSYRVTEQYLEEAETKAKVEICYCPDPVSRLAFSTDSEVIAVAMSHSEMILIQHIPEGRNLGVLHNLTRDVLIDFRFTLAGSVVAVSRSGLVQIWEADGNGVAWPWSRELVNITHYPVDSSSVQILRQAQEMRRRGWLSSQESNLLDLALLLMQNRLSLDIEIDFESELSGDIYDIEIDD